MTAISTPEFNAARFGRCMSHLIVSTWRGWLLRFALMVAVAAVFSVFTSYLWEDSLLYEITNTRFNGFIILFCCLGASNFMEGMSTPSERLQGLMLPASQFEKFLTRWIICLLCVFLSTFVAIVLGKLIGVLWAWWYYGSNISFDAKQLLLLRDLHIEWALLFALQATFMLGATLWATKPFAKTAGWAALLILLWMIIYGLTSVYSLQGYRIVKHDYINSFNALEWLGQTYHSIMIVWGVLCYVIAYLRFKESEIITRF